jgi:hypothetical protein
MGIITMSDARALSVSENKKEGGLERDASPEVDLEKSGPQETLQRQVSGPPYSVFSKSMKIWIIFLVSISALISPFGATTVLPALNVLTDVLDITPTKANISVTTYMVCGKSPKGIYQTDPHRSRKQSRQLSSAPCRTLVAEGCPSFSAISSTSLPILDLLSRPTT